MGNIISLLQEIFMLKEDNSAKVGLSAPKELKLSDLMRKGSY